MGGRVLLGLLLALFACLGCGVRVSLPRAHARLVTRRPFVRVSMGQTSEPSKEGVTEPSPVGGAVPTGDSIEGDLEASEFAPGSDEELADMQAKVAKFQAELDEERRASGFVARGDDDEEDGPFLGGDSIPEFVVNAIKSIPEYEVPPPGAMAQKMGLSLGGFVIAYFLVTLIDGSLIEAIRPIVKYQVDTTPML